MLVSALTHVWKRKIDHFGEQCTIINSGSANVHIKTNSATCNTAFSDDCDFASDGCVTIRPINLVPREIEIFSDGKFAYPGVMSNFLTLHDPENNIAPITIAGVNGDTNRNNCNGNENSDCDDAENANNASASQDKCNDHSSSGGDEMIGSPKDLVLTSPHVRLTHFAVDVLTVTPPEVLSGEELMQLEAGYPLTLSNNAQSTPATAAAAKSAASTAKTPLGSPKSNKMCPNSSSKASNNAVTSTAAWKVERKAQGLKVSVEWGRRVTRMPGLKR